MEDNLRNSIQVYGKMLEGSRPVSMKIALSIKMADNSSVVLRIIV
jgi:hypothetical protein